MKETQDQKVYNAIVSSLTSMKLKSLKGTAKYSIVTEPKALFRKLVATVVPEKREELIKKAELDLYELTVGELIHLAYTKGEDPIKKLSETYSLLFGPLFLPPMWEKSDGEDKNLIVVLEILRDTFKHQLEMANNLDALFKV